MSKHARTPADAAPNEEPRISSCLFHRCEKHARFPQLNRNELGTEGGAECGACIGEELFFLEGRFFDMLDLVALHLTQSSAFKVVLARVVAFVASQHGEAAAQQLQQDLYNDWRRLIETAITRPKPAGDSPAVKTIAELRKLADQKGHGGGNN